MYLEIFPADFAVFRVFLGISRDFAGQRPREISEAMNVATNTSCHSNMFNVYNLYLFQFMV